MLAVTTFSKEGYEKTGKKSLESFVKYWPGKIIVYYEESPGFEHKKIEYRPFYKINGVNNFLTFLSTIPEANGMVYQGKDLRYDYNFDIWKFCRKLFAQYDVLENHNGKVFWLDSDVITKKRVTKKFLTEIFKDECLVFLGRKGFHSETGLVGFDTSHKDFKDFYLRYKGCLKRGIVFSLKRWHDCAVFDWAREGKGTDLSPFWRIGDDLHVWTKTVLQEYMHHYKGQRKNEVN